MLSYFKRIEAFALYSTSMHLKFHCSDVEVSVKVPCLALAVPHFWRSKTGDDDAKDLQAVLSIAILMHSAIGSPHQSFTSSVQRLFGLPLDLLPLMRPCTCRMVVERLPGRTIWPKYFNNLRRWISARKQQLGQVHPELIGLSCVPSSRFSAFSVKIL